MIEKNPAQPYALRTTREADVILAGLSENVGGHWRLPSEQEWLKLARVQDGRWPWGSDLPRKGVHAHLHFLGEGGGIADHPIEVGVFPNGRTRDGLSDLIGNVYELVTRPGGDLALAGGSWTTNFKSASGFRMIREFRSGQGNVGLRPVCETGP